MSRDRRFKYQVHPKNWIEVFDWCMENLGTPHRKSWGMSSGGKVYIVKTEYKVAFKLRWVE